MKQNYIGLSQSKALCLTLLSAPLLFIKVLDLRSLNNRQIALKGISVIFLCHPPSLQLSHLGIGSFKGSIYLCIIFKIWMPLFGFQGGVSRLCLPCLIPLPTKIPRASGRLNRECCIVLLFSNIVLVPVFNWQTGARFE